MQVTNCSFDCKNVNTPSESKLWKLIQIPCKYKGEFQPKIHKNANILGCIQIWKQDTLVYLLTRIKFYLETSFIIYKLFISLIKYS